MKMGDGDWSAIKDEVLQQLRLLDADELADLCTGPGSNITIPASKIGNRAAIHTLVLRYINSEDVENYDDQGLQLFTEMNAELKRILAGRTSNDDEDDKTVLTTPQVTSGGQGNAGMLMNSNDPNKKMLLRNVANGSGSSTQSGVGGGLTSTNFSGGPIQTSGGVLTASNFSSGGPIQNVGGGVMPQNVGAGASSMQSGTGVHYHLKGIREFKIHGGFVASGDNPISYSNLKFQMDDGRDSQKFTEREIMSGVIRAIKPNSVLRSYLESERNLGMKDFLRHIKNHYKLTDSSQLLIDLAGSVQQPNQKIQEFIDKVAQLRNDIITISQEEGIPIDAAMVRRRFLHAITVGIRKGTIRLELQALIKGYPDIPDTELGEEVQKIVAREEEHESKMEETTAKNTKGASSSKLSVNEGSEEGKAIFEELGKINVKINEIAVTKSGEIEDLKQQMFVMQSRQEELGAVAGFGGFGNTGGYYDPGWQGHDGTTYYNNNNNNWNSRGYSGNYGSQVNNNGGNGGPNNRGGNFRGNFRNNNRGNFRNNNRGNFFNNNRGNFHNNNRNNFNNNLNGQQSNQVNQNNQNNQNNQSTGNQNQQQNGSSNRGGSGGNRGGFSGNRGGHGNRGRGGQNGNRRNFPFIKCEECQLSGAFCNHCSNCGSPDHKFKDCPEN